MREVERIADELRRAHEGPAWHGPALNAVLEGVSAERAAARPFPEAHSIWELTGHVAAWHRAALRGLASGNVELGEEENFPPAPASPAEDAWRSALAELERSHTALRAAILLLDDAALEREVVSGGETYTVYFMLHGAIQHALYHAGQMMYIRRAIS